MEVSWGQTDRKDSQACDTRHAQLRCFCLTLIICIFHFINWRPFTCWQSFANSSYSVICRSTAHSFLLKPNCSECSSSSFSNCRNLGVLLHTSTLTVLGLWMCRTSAWQFVWINVASSVFTILFPRIIRVECSLSGFYPSLPATSFFLWWKELRDYLLSHGQTNAQKGEQVEELFGRLDLNEAWWDSEFF